MRLQSGKSFIFYTKEFCQKKIPEIFNLVNFIHFANLAFLHLNKSQLIFRKPQSGAFYSFSSMPFFSLD